MKKNQMSRLSRIVIALSSIALIAVYFMPVWFIFLTAPQYPEGLTMNIWLNKITGQVDIINGLNHYIGMKHIKAEMFPEFKYLIYILGFFILFGLVIALTGKRRLLFAYLVLTIIGGGAAMYDFYQWGYDYGHHLDPAAPIQVPGLSYQPPLIGHKKLLNFDAYSYPDSGGWLVICVASVFFIVWFTEYLKARKQGKKSTRMSHKTIPAIAALAMILFSCHVKPEPFHYGKDICNDCRMTIMEPGFGGEILTLKGRVFKFDDPYCIANFISKGDVKETDIARIVFINYENKTDFLDAKSAWFVVSPQLKSPMNSNAASLSSKANAEKKARETNGEVKSWNELQASFKNAYK